MPGLSPYMLYVCLVCWTSFWAQHGCACVHVANMFALWYGCMNAGHLGSGTIRTDRLCAATTAGRRPNRHHLLLPLPLRHQHPHPLQLHSHHQPLLAPRPHQPLLLTFHLQLLALPPLLSGLLHCRLPLSRRKRTRVRAIMVMPRTSLPSLTSWRKGLRRRPPGWASSGLTRCWLSWRTSREGSRGTGRTGEWASEKGAARTARAGRSEAL
jgi:hypothetical protein